MAEFSADSLIVCDNHLRMVDEFQRRFKSYKNGSAWRVLTDTGPIAAGDKCHFWPLSIEHWPSLGLCSARGHAYRRRYA